MRIITPIGLDLFIFCKYMSIYHKRKSKFMQFVTAICIYAFIIEKISYYLQDKSLLQILLYVTIFPLIGILYDGDFLTKFFRWILIVLVAATLNFIPIFLVFGFNRPNSENTFTLIFMVGYIISRIVIYLIILRIKKKKKIEYFKIGNNRALAIKSIVSLILGIGLLYLLINALIVESMDIKRLSIFICLFTIFCFILISLYDEIHEEADSLIKMAVINMQNQTEKDYAVIIEQKMDDIRKLRHDMKNHLSMINYFANNNNINELKKYLRDMEIPLEPYSLIIIPDQPELSAFLNSKFEIAKMNEIKIDFDFNLNSEVKIPLFDLILVLGNTLDNAIEASKKVEKELREIVCYMGIVNDYLIIDCINRFHPKNSILKKGKFLTTKEEKMLHGQGIGIIEEITEKFEGDLSVEPVNDFFKVSITLKNNIE